jgi:hypothetical protein
VLYGIADKELRIVEGTLRRTRFPVLRLFQAASSENIVRVKEASSSVNLAQPVDQNYFNVLRRKLE